ncbi:amidohydrolase family protein [Amycolatopsis vancoresmycina]|uniref:Amidohydrolase n=1 Tax=Amycolatopsis vancoresmycina DSM 44592 TaxID=1292037 RepID=R1G9T8_9PSEU|nr:amidohydrolase family protein [Amycolatopsis vancoresmycina]EOD68152.1 amidohydrolase [Amycolatopsis vancoresmycina DSM 44592]
MPPLLFRDVRLFDGHGVHPRTSVLADGGRITAVGDGLTAPGADVVAGAGRTLLPGLIDAHVHITRSGLRHGFAFGVTTQLDMFADPAVLWALRAEAARGGAVSDFRSAGTGATAPGGHPAQLVHHGLFGPFPTLASPSEAPAFVAARVAEGSDYLKVFASSVPGEGHRPSLTADAVAALVAAAHEHGLLAVVHAMDVRSALAAVRAGADGLVHLPFDRPPGPEFVAELAARDAFVVPTLTVLESFCGRPGAVEPEAARVLDAAALATLTATMATEATDGYAAGYAADVVAPLARAGVCVLAGTDAGAPGTAHGLSLHRELALLVEAGLTPQAALTAATSAPARRFGLADRGEVVAGKRADLVLVEGDPLADIRATRRPAAVCREGVLHEVRSSG